MNWPRETTLSAHEVTRQSWQMLCCIALNFAEKLLSEATRAD
jgi:hypothetical protein